MNMRICVVTGVFTGKFYDVIQFDDTGEKLQVAVSEGVGT